MTPEEEERIRKEYPLVMDDDVEPMTAKEPAPKPLESKQPVATVKHTIPPKKVPAIASMGREHVVNGDADTLTEYLAGLKPEREAEIKRYRTSLIMNSRSQRRREPPQSSQLSTKNTQLSPQDKEIPPYSCTSCTLRRCGMTEPEILAELWKFSTEHCKPPHNLNNRSDVDELASLARRAAQFVRVGFPAEKKVTVKETAAATALKPQVQVPGGGDHRGRRGNPEDR